MVVKRSTKFDEARLHTGLDRWLTPDQVDMILADFKTEFGKFCGNDRNLQAWREGFHVTSFARAHGAGAIRIGDDPPDFLFRLPEGEFAVEITEVKSSQDLLGKDFIHWAELEEQGLGMPTTSYDPSDDWHEAPDRIRQAVAAKMGKPYPPETILAVAVSSFWFGDNDPKTVQRIEEACTDGITKFREIWISVGSHHLTFSGI